MIVHAISRSREADLANIDRSGVGNFAFLGHSGATEGCRQLVRSFRLVCINDAAVSTYSRAHYEGEKQIHDTQDEEKPSCDCREGLRAGSCHAKAIIDKTSMSAYDRMNIQHLRSYQCTCYDNEHALNWCSPSLTSC